LRRKLRDFDVADDTQLIQEQIVYYRERAPEYDDWFFRRGRYNGGADHTRYWFDEIEEVRSALTAARPVGHVLELACGTGLWTEQLAPQATQLTAIDSSPEVIELNRQRVASPRVAYQIADLFTWEPDARYDFVFFGFWLSHVPMSRFIPFWSTIGRCLAPGGRVFFVDSRYHPASTALYHSSNNAPETRSRRRLQDGREFEIVKIFYKPDDLAVRLTSLGWRQRIRGTANFFVYGTADLNDGDVVPRTGR